MQAQGAQILLQRLSAHGVDTVFGYPGGAILPVYEALRVAIAEGRRLRHVLVRHEQAAIFAAEGYARVTGRLGVAIATSGPGATNLVTGIADAMADSIPVLILTGQVSTAALGTEAFQEVDIVHATAKMTKWSTQVRHPAELGSTIDEAIARATSGRPGPVVVDLPKDVQLGLADVDERRPRTVTSQPRPAPWGDSLLAMLRAAKRPLLFTGGGIRAARSTAALREFAARTNLPQVNSLLGLGNGLPGDPLALGMVGMFGTPAANEAVARCDLLLALGVRFDDRATCDLASFAADARVIHIDIEPKQLGRRRHADLPICADLADIWPALERAPSCPPAWQGWCREAASTSREFRRGGSQAIAWLRALDEHLAHGDIVTCDVGNHQMWSARCLRFTDAHHHLTSGGLGAMGFGLPAAVGAQIARPGHRVVCVTGDGSFLMNVQELATLVRYRLPVKIVLFDNSSLGMVRQQQSELFGGDSENDLSDNPDFVALARSFGVKAWAAEGDTAPHPTLETWLAEPGPALLRVRIERDDEVWPWVPPSRPHHPMVPKACLAAP